MESLYGLDYLKLGKNGGFDHIIWSNGAKDPWYVGGVLENLPGENIVIVMPNGKPFYWNINYKNLLFLGILNLT